MRRTDEPQTSDLILREMSRRHGGSSDRYFAWLRAQRVSNPDIATGRQTEDGLNRRISEAGKIRIMPNG